MPKNMGKPEFSGKISKDLTTFMHFEIKSFGNVLKVSGHIIKIFSFLWKYIPLTQKLLIVVFPPFFAHGHLL